MYINTDLTNDKYKPFTHTSLILPPTPPHGQDHHLEREPEQEQEQYQDQDQKSTLIEKFLLFTDHSGRIITTRRVPGTEEEKSRESEIVEEERRLEKEKKDKGQEKENTETLSVRNSDRQESQEKEEYRNTADTMAPARLEDRGVENKGFDVAIKECAVTEERIPFMERGSEKTLKEPGTARANEAASVEAPDGTQKDNYAQRNKHLTVLQQHITFFDRSRTGIIYPHDTYLSFRRLAYNPFLALLAMFIIHINFSYPTLPPGHWLPDPFFRVYVERIHKDKHGSDSGTYDNEGRFVPQKFEDIFAKYAGGDKQGITMGETWEYMRGQRVIMDPVGWGGALFEWIATWILLWPEDGRMKKDDIRRIYDGSLFYEIAERNEGKKIR